MGNAIMFKRTDFTGQFGDKQNLVNLIDLSTIVNLLNNNYRGWNLPADHVIRCKCLQPVQRWLKQARLTPLTVLCNG